MNKAHTGVAYIFKPRKPLISWIGKPFPCNSQALLQQQINLNIPEKRVVHEVDCYT